MISLRQIEVIRAVLLAHTVSGAAELLNVSAAAVSRMLKHTESQIGFELFARGRSGLVPTPEAAELLGDLQEVHARLKRIQYRLQRRSRNEVPLTIGASSGLGQSLVPRVLASLRTVKPELSCEVNILHIDEIVPHLELSACDFVLTIFDMSDPRLVCQRLAEAELICLAPEGIFPPGRRSITLEEIADNDLVGFDRRSFQQRMIDDLFAKHHLQPRICARARLMTTAHALVVEGLGIGLLDGFTVFGDPPARTSILRVEQPVIFPLNVISSRKNPLSQESHLFLTTLRRLVAKEASRSPFLRA
jgi:DNA-binding transcriptional LysR family regulator